MIRRSSAMKQRARGAPRLKHIRLILMVKDRECVNTEYPIERQDNKDMHEPADVKIVMTQGCSHSYREVLFLTCLFFFPFVCLFSVLLLFLVLFVCYLSIYLRQQWHFLQSFVTRHSYARFCTAALVPRWALSQEARYHHNILRPGLLRQTSEWERRVCKSSAYDNTLVWFALP